MQKPFTKAQIVSISKKKKVHDHHPCLCPTDSSLKTPWSRHVSENVSMKPYKHLRLILFLNSTPPAKTQPHTISTPI